jgi:hypothetical protein
MGFLRGLENLELLERNFPWNLWRKIVIIIGCDLDEISEQLSGYSEVF